MLRGIVVDDGRAVTVVGQRLVHRDLARREAGPFEQVLRLPVPRQRGRLDAWQTGAAHDLDRPLDHRVAEAELTPAFLDEDMGDDPSRLLRREVEQDVPEHDVVEGGDEGMNGRVREQPPASRPRGTRPGAAALPARRRSSPRAACSSWRSASMSASVAARTTGSMRPLLRLQLADLAQDRATVAMGRLVGADRRRARPWSASRGAARPATRRGCRSPRSARTWPIPVASSAAGDG